MAKDIDNKFIEESYPENLDNFVLLWWKTKDQQEQHDIENFLFDFQFKSSIHNRKNFYE